MSDSFQPPEEPPTPGSPPPPGPGGQPNPLPQPDPSRTTNRLLGWVLAALVVVIALIAWSQIRDTSEPTPLATTTTSALAEATTTEPGETTTTTTTAGETTTTTGPTTTTSGPSTTTTSTPVAPAPGSAVEAVRSFVTAIAIRDLDTAWALMDQRSRAEVGSREQLDAYTLEYVEGYTAWASADELAQYSNPVDSTDGSGELSVVTLAGEVTGEGVTEFGTFSMPVTSPDGETYLVLAFLREGSVEFIIPDGSVPPPAVVSNATAFEVIISNAVDSVYFAIDDTIVSEGLVTEGPDGTITVTAAYDELAPGDHILTVFFTAGDSLTSDALPFTVR